MKKSDIEKLIIKSLSPDTETGSYREKLDQAGVSYSFGKDFTEKVIGRIVWGGVVIHREMDFLKSLNRAFYRIALTGVAAIVILLISIFIMEGSLSFNSFLGLSNNYDESIVCLLTGN